MEFWGLFFGCLYLDWSSKVLLEASGLGLGSILQGGGTDFGRVLDGFWEGIWSIPGDSGLFWMILGYGDVLRRSWTDSGGSGGIFEDSGSRNSFLLFSAAVSGLCWALLVFTKAWMASEASQRAKRAL